jgi:hypothetical protein
MGVASCLGITLWFSRGVSDSGGTLEANTKPGFVAEVQDKNPWTSLQANIAPDQFQFAIISDRTGGHRAGVFSRAVQQINLLQPEFVMSVGDLIEGSPKEDQNQKEWTEFNGYVKQLQMPFFYIPGNHDANLKVKADIWKEAYGRRNFSFVYKNCLFVGLNTSDEDQDNPATDDGYKKVRIGAKQREWLKAELAKNSQVRWTFLFLHHPLWNFKALDENGWLEVEDLLESRQYTVFAGHVHVFRKSIRKGRNLYQLATTGGGSSMRGSDYGEIDQIAWVTMKGKEPVISQIGLHGVYRDDLQPIETGEGGASNQQPKGMVRVRGTITIGGKPATDTLVVFTRIEEPKVDANGRRRERTSGNSRTAKDGSFEVYAPRGALGLPPGKYQVHFVPAPKLVVDDKAPPIENTIPEKYRTAATTPLVVDVPQGEGVNLNLNVE